MANRLTLKTLKDAMKQVNQNGSLRALGSCDTTMGIKAGKKCYNVIFSAFEISDVQEISEEDLRDLDFYFEMSRADWESFIANQASEAPVGVNELDLLEDVVKSRDARGKLNFTRYHRSVQHFFSCVGS